MVIDYLIGKTDCVSQLSPRPLWTAVSSIENSMPRDKAAPPSHPMRHGRIPNKPQNPHTIAAREQFRTNPRRSPRGHRKSQRLDRREQKAAAADRAATSKNREGTTLPDPISAAKNWAVAFPFSTAQSILRRRVDTLGVAEDEFRRQRLV